MFLRLLLTVLLLLILVSTLTLANSTSYTSGQYTIVFRHSEGPGSDQISVFHSKDPDRALWETDANASYLTAVQDKERIYQNGGIFLVSENEEIVCSDATITEIIDTNKSEGYNAVTVMGNFCGVCAYSMEFAATDVVKSSFQHLTLSVNIPDCSDHFNGVVLQWSSHSNESFYGFGHQYTHINMKGHRLPVFLREKGVGRGLEPLTAFMDIFGPFAGGSWHTTYTQVPFYVTSEMRSFLLDSPEYAIFDMTRPDLVSLHLTSPVLQARIIYGQTDS